MLDASKHFSSLSFLQVINNIQVQSLRKNLADTWSALRRRNVLALFFISRKTDWVGLSMNNSRWRRKRGSFIKDLMTEFSLKNISIIKTDKSWLSYLNMFWINCSLSSTLLTVCLSIVSRLRPHSWFWFNLIFDGRGSPDPPDINTDWNIVNFSWTEEHCH